MRRESDSLAHLGQLIDHGEKKGLFLEEIPPRIQHIVREENLRFRRNRDTYSDAYFDFINRLSVVNTVSANTDMLKLSTTFGKF